MSAINAGEVYYFLFKHREEKLAESWRESSGTLPATIEVPTADEIWDAAELKARYPIACADAFAAALAQKYECPLVTGDRELRLIAGLSTDPAHNAAPRGGKSGVRVSARSRAGRCALELDWPGPAEPSRRGPR